MYEAYWNLKKRPFDDGAFPEAYFPGQMHQSALLKLRYLNEQDKGVALIVGEHGLGKTFLTHVLEHESKADGIGPFIRFVVPTLSANETLAYFCHRLGQPVASTSGNEAVHAALEDSLGKLKEQGRHPVFVVDDAHLWDVEQLQTLRLLLNWRENGVGRFSVVLAGRPELLAQVKRVPSLEQRIAVRIALKPLTVEDVQAYIHRRLEAAGIDREIVDADTAAMIWRLSQGIPRKINQICDLALLIGFVDQLPGLSPIEAQAAAEELNSLID